MPEPMGSELRCWCLLVAKQSLEDGVGDGVLCQNGVNLFNTDVDLIQSLSEHLDFLGEALKLCPVNHVRQTAELVGVEEAPAVQGCADETLRSTTVETWSLCASGGWCIPCLPSQMNRATPPTERWTPCWN